VQQALEHFVQKEEVFGFTNQDTKQEVFFLLLKIIKYK
jgi:hypothetical protein